MKYTFVDVYRHISGDDVPTGHEDQEFRCSVYKRQNTTIILSAVDCLSRYQSLCLQTDRNATAITVLPHHAQFEIAREQCNLIQTETINIDAISQLVTGKGYWTGIHRVPVEHWLKQESGNDICNEMAAKVNVKCIMVDRKAKDWVLFVPLPCTESFTAICKGNKLKATEKISDDCKDESRQNDRTSERTQFSFLTKNLEQRTTIQINTTVSRITTQSTSETSSTDQHAKRTSQLMSTILNKSESLNTTVIQTTANWSTGKSVHMSTVKRKADQTSLSVTSITDNIVHVSQYTTIHQSFTDWSTNHILSSTTTETHNHTVVVYIITGCVFLLSLLVSTVAIVAVILHKREKCNNRTQTIMNNMTTPTERRATAKVHKGNLRNNGNDNQYQLKLLIPEALHRTCNIEMSQAELFSNLQAFRDTNVNHVNSRNSKMHDAFSRVRRTIVTTGQNSDNRSISK